MIGFGGGSALIPIVEKEVVEEKKAISKLDYLKHTVVANITPGALPVKLGATCGYQLKGIPDALAGAYGVMLPGVLLTLLGMVLFSILGTNTIQYFNYASVGIPLFDISTIHLILISFFIILLLDKLVSKIEIILSVLLSLTYAFSVGKTGISLGFNRYSNALLIFMILLLLAAGVSVTFFMFL